MWEKSTDGLGGTGFSLGPIGVNRKPDVLVVFRNWWGPENKAGIKARKLGIPVVMIDHGMLMVGVPIRHSYRSSIYPSNVGCLWSHLHLEMFRRLNKNDDFVVTGNPLYDQMIGYVPPEIDVPDEFALLLTGRSQTKFLRPSAEALNKIMPVVAKVHPVDTERDYYVKRYQTFDDYRTLLPLLCRAKIIIASLSSGWIPALFWEKPIFIHGFEEEDLRFNEFVDNYSHIFNFKQAAAWSDDIIENAIRPTKEDFELFGHTLDGKNAERVANVIKGYI